MKEFEPSHDFVAKVMQHIRTQTKIEHWLPYSGRGPFHGRLWQYAMSISTIFFGVINIIRLYFAVFSPVLCR